MSGPLEMMNSIVDRRSDHQAPEERTTAYSSWVAMMSELPTLPMFDPKIFPPYFGHTIVWIVPCILLSTGLAFGSTA